MYCPVNKFYEWCSCAAIYSRTCSPSAFDVMWSLWISLTQLLDGKRKGVMRWVGSKQASCIDGDPSFHILWWLSNILKLVNRACSCQLLFPSFEIFSQWWNNRYSMLRVVVNCLFILDLFVLARGFRFAKEQSICSKKDVLEPFARLAPKSYLFGHFRTYSVIY